MREKINIWINHVRVWLMPVISLVVALTALSYKTWRNEMSERNRNVRPTGFEIMKELAALQLFTSHAHYDHNQTQGNPIAR